VGACWDKDLLTCSGIAAPGRASGGGAADNSPTLKPSKHKIPINFEDSLTFIQHSLYFAFQKDSKLWLLYQ
jgi:hypothetical protein